MAMVCVTFVDREVMLQQLRNDERCFRVPRWQAERLANLRCPEGRLERIEDSDPLRLPRCYTVATR
jgi:hypothetical protein